MSEKEVFRRAAERIASGHSHGVCHAIIKQYPFTLSGESMKLQMKFHGLFKPAHRPRPYYFGEFNEKNQLARSLALLFMEQISKAKP